MDKKEPLNHFLEEIMSIQPPAFNMFGKGLPGNAGASVSQEGALNSGMDVTRQLKQKAIAFAEAYGSKNTDKSKIADLANELEGCILDEQLVDILNKKQAYKLIDELHVIKANCLVAAS